MSKQGIAPGQARILVVEDDDNNRLVITMLLKAAGVLPEHMFAIEGDPVPYIQSKLNNQLDLILLDLQLPGKDGYEILSELRQHPTLSRIPVVAVTANVMKSDFDKALAACFDGFIGKPINGPRFGHWLGRLLAGQRIWRVV